MPTCRARWRGSSSGDRGTFSFDVTNGIGLRRAGTLPALSGGRRGFSESSDFDGTDGGVRLAYRVCRTSAGLRNATAPHVFRVASCQKSRTI